MHEYLFRPEVVRMALVVGIVVSMLFYERIQLTTGGAIVPAYLAVFIPAPLHILVTLLSGYCTYLIVSVALPKRKILYGRRKFEVEVLVGLGFVTVGTIVARAFGGADPRYAALVGIGFLVPGVIAHDMFRQKPKRTLTAVALTTGVVALFVYVAESLIDIAPITRDVRLEPFRATAGYPQEWLLYAIIVSVVLGMLLFSKLGLRGGGFIGGAYLAFVLPRLWDLLFTAVVAFITWAIVTKIVMPRLLVFGRRKLSTMVLIGSIVAWSGEAIMVAVTSGAWVPWQGFTVITLVVPSLLANDAQRQGIERTVWGAGLTALGVFGTVNLTIGVLGLFG